MRKVIKAVTVICLIWGLTGCGNSVPEEEPPQSFSNIETGEVPEETKSEGQSDEIQNEAEINSRLPTEQEEQEQIQSEQTEEIGLEIEEMSILMKSGDETVTVAWEDNESVRLIGTLINGRSDLLGTIVIGSPVKQIDLTVFCNSGCGLLQTLFSLFAASGLVSALRSLVIHFGW